MVNLEDATTSSGDALNVHGHTEQKNANSGGKGKGNQRGRSKSKGPSDELFCRYCKRKNHNIDNYCKLQNKKRNNTSKPKGKTDGSASDASDNSSDNGDILNAFARCASDDYLWILDSACLYHVYINRALFSTYDPV
jgi:hypothetical protein